MQRIIRIVYISCQLTILIPNMPDPRPPRRWSVEQRLGFIERRLYWEGRINRADLMSRFGISVPQASADLKMYDARAPGNLAYDLRAKTYVAASGMRPQLVGPSAREYLAQLQLIADGVLQGEDSWLGTIPSFGTVPRVRRRLAAPVLQQVISALRNEFSLEIEYQSLSSPDPTKRWISPHALSFDGFRWHARAWCHSRERFLDFVLARFLAIGASAPRQVDPKLDHAWHKTALLRLAPNPALSAAQQRVVELDFGMVEGIVEIEVRLCLVYYFKRQMLLDLDPFELPAGRIQLVLLNSTEVDMALKEVGEST